MKKNIFTLFLTLSLSYAGISGVAYFEYEDSFSLSRTYLTYENTISDELSFKFQTDVGEIDDAVTSDDDQDVDNDDRWVAYLKKAQLDWKINPNMKITMGMIGLNMFNVQEKTWGNRFISKSAMDANGFSKSADLGFGITQKLGQVTASLLMTNGEGYKESDVDDENKMSLQLLMGEKRLDKNDGYNVGVVYSTLEDETVTGIFGGWASGNVVVGGEYNTKDDGEVTDELTSVYANYEVNDNLSAFVRMDNFDDDTDSSGGEDETTMAGLIWTPTKGLDICLNRTSVTVNDDADDTTKLNFQFKF